MNTIQENSEKMMVVYSSDAINNILNIIDKTFTFNGINQIMAVSAIVNELTHPYKEMELKEFTDKNIDTNESIKVEKDNK